MPGSLIPRTPARPAGPALCVLASSSSGNCSVLTLPGLSSALRPSPSFPLLDMGLGLRRTRAELSRLGLSLDDAAAVILTHLDVDHWNAGWSRWLPARTRILAHRRHVEHGVRRGVLPRRVEPLDGAPDLPGGVAAHPALLAHDALGVATLRFDLPGGGSLGWATDVGRVSPGLVEHLAGVGVLAIESNYCPRMQAASDRPWWLKQRIMGGSGHLSNEQCAEAVARIAPVRHVVLLHLSRDCNRPEIAARHHGRAPYALTIASPEYATPWVPIGVDDEGDSSDYAAETLGAATAPPAGAPATAARAPFAPGPPP